MTDLLPYNTFRVSAMARDFAILRSPADWPKTSGPVLILGRGANVLFTKDWPDLVLKNEVFGKKILAETATDVTLEIASGEDWPEFVIWTAQNNWSGVENLAAIPGTVGAAPVQNIAAYGQQVADTIIQVNTLNKVFLNDRCHFSYRASLFQKEKVFITSVIFKLSKTAHFATNYQSRYESLERQLQKTGKKPPFTPLDIVQTVTSLRKAKLPDITKVGSAGSFFKNPNVSLKKFQELAHEIKELQSYPAPEGQVKIPAGRLLEELGWRGKKIGRVATHEKHALIIINLGGATGNEIFEFSQKMQSDVSRAYAINLEPEVNIL